MVIELPVAGYFKENCFLYLEERTRHGFLIDPGAEDPSLLRFLKENRITVEKILLTHGHFDHLGAVDFLRGALGVPVYASSERYLLDDQWNLSAKCGPSIVVEGARLFSDGEVFRLDADPAFALRAIFAPGHTTDSVIYYSEGDGVAFVGDMILNSSVGIYTFPGGEKEQLLRSLSEKLLTLPDDTILYSGHSKATTVAKAKQRIRLWQHS